MKHLICSIDRISGVYTITTPDGYQVLKREPNQPSVAHKEAWSTLMKLYDELVRGEELAN
jgi:hypothetical protein